MHSSFFSRDARIKLRIKKTKRVNIKDFKEGRDPRIVGKLSFIGEPLKSPLTTRFCAFYKIEILEHKGSGNNKYWRRIIEDYDSQPFLLTDDTG